MFVIKPCAKVSSKKIVWEPRIITYNSKYVNKQDEKGCTPLHYAAKNRSDESVLKLMRNGKKKT